MIVIMETNHDKSLKLLGNAPLYIQVKQRLLEALAQGIWKAGDLIPSEMELAELYDVSQGTIRKAIEDLSAENLLVRRQGKGTFVETHQEERSRYRFLHLMHDHGYEINFSTRILLCQHLLGPKDVCDSLELPPETLMLHIRRLMSNGDVPTVLEDIWLPSHRFEGLNLDVLQAWNGTMYGLFEGQFGVHMVRAHEKLKAVRANNLAMEYLKVEKDTSLLEISRISYTYENQAIELRVALNLTRDFHYFNTLN